MNSLVERLGQSPELLAQTSVISPETSVRLATDQTRASIRLVAGSAVVFEKGVVNRGRLPASLPKPIESNIAMGAQSGLIGHPQGQSTELRNLGEKVFGSSSDSNDFPASISQQTTQESSPPALPDIAPAIEDRASEVAPPTFTSRPPIATVPFTGSPQITNSSTVTRQTEVSTNEPIPRPDDSAANRNSVAPTIAPSLSLDEMEETIEEPTSRLAAVPMVILLVIVGGLSAIAVALRRNQGAQRYAVLRNRYRFPQLNRRHRRPNQYRWSKSRRNRS